MEAADHDESQGRRETTRRNVPLCTLDRDPEREGVLTMNDHDQSRNARRRLLAQLAPSPVAWSVNGRDIVFMGGFDLGVEIGGFVTVTLSDGARLLAQVHDLRLIVRDSLRVDVDTDELDGNDSMVRGANVGVALRFIEGEGLVLGRLDDGRLVPAHTLGFGEADVAPAEPADVSALVGNAVGTSAVLNVGRLSATDLDANLKASGFSRHTFLCGQSGSGKTYSMGVLLERLLIETDLPMVVVDPNSDYVGLGKLRSREEINRSRALPLSEQAYAELEARYEERARVAVARSSGGDLPLRIHFSDLSLDDQALTLDLDALRDADEYAALVDAIGALNKDRYGIEHIVELLHHRFDESSGRLARRIANLRIGGWTIWAAPEESSLADLVSGARAVVLDTGSLSDARERSVIVLALLGRLRHRPLRSAVSVVIDEAHNVCSPDASTRLERAVSAHAEWIAAEGRKFGIYLVLSTQRPQKIHRNVLSQCDNLLLMRVNSATDLAELASVFSHVPHSMVLEAQSFQLGEMLAAGPVAPTPLRLRMGERWSPEGGADLPLTWAARKSE
jgi:uncharacterized protein